MLFNSYEFLLIFLPVVLAGYYLIPLKFRNYWLIASSLFFYGWWDIRYVPLLVGSICFNFFIAKKIGKKPVFIFAIIVNLLLLAYFKYTNFFLDQFESTLGLDDVTLKIILPLGISFFTFQQIVYLADIRSGRIPFSRDLVKYMAIVTFFPHLIAGPIVHYKAVMYDFSERNRRRFAKLNLITGLSIFVIGLAKKVMIADALAPYASRVFDAAAAGADISLIEAWGGPLAYTFQLYFDFSGYSDMALGLAWMFGIKFPFNFFSPYKSFSITEFWRRWHITLSEMFRDYVYIPMGGSHKGAFITARNLLITMFLAGLWHGAGWTFVVWGLLHGAYLVEERFVTLPLQKKLGLNIFTKPVFSALFLLKVCIAWVLFRAADMEAAKNLLCAMFSFDYIIVHSRLSFLADILPFEISTGPMPVFGSVLGLVLIAGAFLLALFGKSIPEVRSALGRGVPGNRMFVMNPKLAFLQGIAVILLLAASLLLLGQPSEFLYFQF